MERMRKHREKQPKVDLKRLSVPEALKYLHERKTSLFNDEAKLFSIELERMINSIDEKQLIQYIREELIRRENIEIVKG